MPDCREKGKSVEQFTCQLCGGTESSLCFSALDFDHSVEQFDILQCTRCGLAMTGSTHDPAGIDGYYRESYYGSGKKKFSGVIEFLTEMACKLRAKKVLKEVSNSRSGEDAYKILDVGCGRANLLRCLKDFGCECYGTERTNFPTGSHLAGVEIFRGSVAERKYKNCFFDAVVIWHVLEHLHEPFITLDEIARITRNGGVIAIAVPNFSSLQSKLFKSDWFHLDLPRHLYHFNVDNLCRALAQRGYLIHFVGTSSLEQNIFGFIQSFLNKLKPLGKQNEFYQLLKKRSGLAHTLKLIFWLTIAALIMPLAIIEFVISSILKKGASAIVFAHKT